MSVSLKRKKNNSRVNFASAAVRAKRGNNRGVIFQEQIRLGKVFVLAQGKEGMNTNVFLSSLSYFHRFFFPVFLMSSNRAKKVSMVPELRHSF